MQHADGRLEVDGGRLAAADCTVMELRQYTLHPGKRDVLISLFDREFVETQEAEGMLIVGQFRDIDDANRFVWVRGFRDMHARLRALGGFYGGPVWKQHREEANSTMEDSSDVRLLRPVGATVFGDLPKDRPSTDVDHRGGSDSLVVATIYALRPDTREQFATYRDDLTAIMARNGGVALAVFETEPSENTFPALPVRVDEDNVVIFTRFADSTEYERHRDARAADVAWNDISAYIDELLIGEPRELRLRPTGRSLLR